MNLPLTKRKYTFLIGNMLNFMTFHVLTAKSVNEDGCLLRSAPCSLIERPTDQRFNRTSASETSCQYLPEYTVQHLTRQPSSRTMWFVNSTYITSGAEIWHHCLTHVMEVWQVLVRLYPTGRCFLFHWKNPLTFFPALNLSTNNHLKLVNNPPYRSENYFKDLHGAKSKWRARGCVLKELKARGLWG